MSLGVAAATPGFAATISLAPIKDNTLIETADGSLSNGSGPALFAGRTGQSSGSIRRGLLAFDVAGSLPEGAVIDSVDLYLQRTSGESSPSVLRLHRVVSDWGEGASSSDRGQGAPSALGDATWIHTFYDADHPADPNDRWSLPGGDFEPAASADLVANIGDEFRWSSSSMVADVQDWLDNPASNFGWLLLGDESQGGTTVKFASREFPNAASRPSLVVHYTPVPEPSTALMVYLGLGIIGARHRRSRAASSLFGR